MKKTLLLLTAATCTIILLNSQSGGPSAGLTSSPGDNSANCTNCHRGTALPTSGMITSDIPSSGYVPGQTYKVTFTISETGRTKFGFQMTAEDGSNNKAGLFTGSTDTKILNRGDYITHISNSTTSTDSQSWTVDWTAPASGTGTVTFYGSGNAANGDRGTMGDIIKTSSLQVSESSGSTSIQAFVSNSEISVYPNPASNEIFLSGLRGAFEVYDLSGMLRIRGDYQGNGIDITNLDEGIYFVRAENSTDVLRFVKR